MDSLAPRVPPTELRNRFLCILSRERPSAYADLAEAMGSGDKSRPKRPVQKYIETARVFGLADDTGTGVLLTYRGGTFLRGQDGTRAALASAFHASPVAREVLSALCGPPQVADEEELDRRIVARGIPGGARAWVPWLEAAGLLASAEGTMRVRTRPHQAEVVAMYTQTELGCIEEALYRGLCALAESAQAESGGGLADRIDKAFADFRQVPAERAEPAMLAALSLALNTLGFTCQTRNGPREGPDSRSSPETRLEFGAQGDDLGAFFLCPGRLDEVNSVGYALACEAKRTSADKKCVTQALAFRGRLETYFSQQGHAVTAWAVAVSDSEAYSERAARDYAQDNRVMHLPVEALRGLALSQAERFTKCDTLLTPPAVLQVLAEFSRAGEWEPTGEDWRNAVEDVMRAKLP